MTTYGLLDTSVLIAREQARPLIVSNLPDVLGLSVVTIAELHVGVHAARDPETRQRRLTTLDRAGEFQVYPIDTDAAVEWARLRYRLGQVGRRIHINDLWIAAVALSQGMPVVTQDDDFDVLADLNGPAVIKV